MRFMPWLPIAGLFTLLACQPRVEQPVTIRNAALGLVVTFPGQPQQIMYTEETPLGNIMWYNLTYLPKGGVNAPTLHVDVGSPTGKTFTAKALLDGFQAHLRQQLGPLTVEALPPDRGPGFRYAAEKHYDRILEGIVIVRRGRIHHAQGAAKGPGDPDFKAFLDGFTVAAGS